MNSRSLESNIISNLNPNDSTFSECLSTREEIQFYLDTQQRESTNLYKMVDFSMFSWFDYLLGLSVLLFFVYLYLTKDYGYFKKKGIPYEKPYLYFGSMLELFVGRKCIYDMMIRFVHILFIVL